MASPTRISIVGAGLAGNLLAIFLARRGMHPLVVERHSRASMYETGGGRSINLALAARGIAALERAELRKEIEPLLLPMPGRMIHEQDETQRFSPYGQTAQERIYSISRARLNLELYRIAHERYGVDYRFDCECRSIDAASMAPIVVDPEGTTTLSSDVTFAADGAGSAIRRALLDHGAISAVESLLDHGYKELEIAPDRTGEFVLEAGALHIWPRDDFMLIALPNTDKSFTATLFLPLEGPVSFRTLDSADAVRGFFCEQFPDATRVIRELEQQFAANPTGVLGTVRCHPWSHAGPRRASRKESDARARAGGGRLLLLGDAAHAIVPFHGQGMNAAFEDIVELDRLIAIHDADWPRVFDAFEATRLPNANAIADMALDNYLEMRALVRDPKFQLQRELELELERRFGARFIPRYAMVMFHPEITYAQAQRRGVEQRVLLDRLTRDADSLTAVDFDLAAKLVERLSG
jgi:kynurenine 3-monooxygenase